MKQLFGRPDGPFSREVPDPPAGPGQILVAVRHSIISSGTETAAFDPEAFAGRPDESAGLLQVTTRALPPVERWSLCGAAERASDGLITAGPEPFGYVLDSGPLTLPAGDRVRASLQVEVERGNLSFGALDGEASHWLTTASRARPRRRMGLSIETTVPADGRLRLMISNHKSPSPAEADATGEPTHLRVLALELKTVATSGVESGAASGAAGGPVRRLLDRLRGASAAEPALAEEALPASELPVLDLDGAAWTLGYSCAGVVLAVGPDITDLSPGDRVACAGAGKANHAERVRVPRRLCCRIPEGLSTAEAAMGTIGAIALQGLRRAAPELGESVAVLGLGLLGQLTVQLLVANGVEVLAFDPIPGRAARAAALGAAFASADASEFAARARRRCDGRGVDATLVTASSRKPGILDEAARLTRERGRVVLVGDVPIHLDRAVFYRRELELRMSRSYGPGRHDVDYEERGRDYPLPFVRWTIERNMRAFLELCRSGQVDPAALVDLALPATEARRGYASLMAEDAEARPIAVRLSFADDPGPSCAFVTPAGLQDPAPGAGPAGSGPCRVALLGAGGFATAMLAPTLLELPELFELTTLVSRDPARGARAVRELGIPRQAADPAAVFADDAIDAVIIATRHHEHAELALAALAAGKAVWLEKPAALTAADLSRLEEALAKPGARLTVGYNRRHAPAVTALRERLAGLSEAGPASLLIRVNAGALPADHWTLGPEGGGRNLGEACHFYDLMLDLLGEPVALEALAAGGGARRDETFAVSLRFAGGAIAQLHYSALGSGASGGFGKERIELFQGGRSFLIDDFERLESSESTAPLWSGPRDKGHRAALTAFGEALRDGARLPGDPLSAAAVALAVEQRLRGAGAGPEV